MNADVSAIFVQRSCATESVLEMSKTEIQRTDRANSSENLMDDLKRLRQPLAGESALANALNPMVREGDLYEKLPDHRVHCYACAHNCNIADGGRGICRGRSRCRGGFSRRLIVWARLGVLSRGVCGQNARKEQTD